MGGPGPGNAPEEAKRNTFDNNRPAEQIEARQETTQAPDIQGLALGTPRGIEQGPNSSGKQGFATQRDANSDALSGDSAPIDPELAEVVRAWPTLPAGVKADVLARVGERKIDFAKLAAECAVAMRPEALARLAAALGVSLESLVRLGIGWSAKHRAWTFPMRDADGAVLGIRLRLPGGKKIAVKGGHDGLFIPEGIDARGLVLVCEGPTDTAALLDLGFNAVGRPSCRGGVKLLVDLVQKHRPSGVVIVSDGDAPGQRGGESLAALLVAYSAAVRIIAPPSGVKDAREWKRCGATAADVQAAIDAAPMRKLAVSTRIRRKAGSNHGR